MGTQSSTHPRSPTRASMVAMVCVVGWVLRCAGQTTVASSVPLILPTTVVFDTAGNLYVAETNRHVIDRIDGSGALTVVAGNGTQGYSGDGGFATAAQLDSPLGLAVDASGNLYIADTHNHRIREVLAGSGTITTVAGTGSAGYSGDGGQAVRAQLSLPTALALDGLGSLYLADANNHRVRQMVLATGVLRTVAGNGTQGYAGDGGLAVNAAIDTPTGLAVDGAGNVYLADTHNGRVRRVAHDTGVIATVAGGDAPAGTARLRLPRGLSLDIAGNLYIADTQAHRILRVAADGTIAVVAGAGTQGYAGDSGPATAALLDSPRSAAVSSGGLIALADTGNQRVREVGPDGVIRAFGGIGVSSPQMSLTLTSPSVVLYGTGAITATLASTTAASGAVSFYEAASGVLSLLESGTLAANAAAFSTARLAAGSHRILATYAGDASHASVESSVIALTVSPALVSVAPASATVLYGQAIPALAGAITGVLAQDAGSVTAVLATSATSLSPVGSYPVSVALSGAAAGNYQLLSASGGALTIVQAPTTTSLAANAASASPGSMVTLSARVVSTTQGVPTGRVSFLDAGSAMGTSALDASGTGTLAATLGAGTHSVTAVYSGDGNFLASLSSSVSEVITTIPTNPVSVVSADFALMASGNVSQTAVAGASATYAFAVSVQNGPLNSPILLTASGMPLGATATFSPTYLPPGGAVSTFTLTVQTVSKSARAEPASRTVLAAMLAVLLVPLGLRRRRIECVAVFVGLFLAGCGDRVATLPTAKTTSVVYPMVVTATSTSAAGTVLQHTAAVTLTVP